MCTVRQFLILCHQNCGRISLHNHSASYSRVSSLNKQMMRNKLNQLKFNMVNKKMVFTQNYEARACKLRHFLLLKNLVLDPKLNCPFVEH